MIIILFMLFACISAAPKGNVAKEGFGLESFMSGLKLQVHGHYCGLNHGDSNYLQSTSFGRKLNL
jgi:hypothetical protein